MDSKEVDNTPTSKSFRLQSKQYGNGQYLLCFILISAIFSTSFKPHTALTFALFAVGQMAFSLAMFYFLTLWIMDLVRRWRKIEGTGSKKVRLVINLIFAGLFLLGVIPFLLRIF